MTKRLAIIAEVVLSAVLISAVVALVQFGISQPAVAQAIVPQINLPLPPAAPAGPPASGSPDHSEMSQLQTFANTPGYKALNKQALDSIPPEVFKSCPSLVSSDSRITVIMPLQFDDKGAPVAGVWKHSYPVSGCGPDTILNFYFLVRPDHTIGFLVGTPGSTHISPARQHDAETVAIAGAAAALQDQGAVPCPSYVITNSSFQSYGLANPPTPDPGSADPLRPWWENWTVAGCGRAFLVPLDVIPHQGQPIEITQPGHVTQVRLLSPVQDAPNPYALPAPKPPAGAPPSGTPASGAPAVGKPAVNTLPNAKP